MGTSISCAQAVVSDPFGMFILYELTKEAMYSVKVRKGAALKSEHTVLYVSMLTDAAIIC
jgi:hypothetical protein